MRSKSIDIIAFVLAAAVAAALVGVLSFAAFPRRPAAAPDGQGIALSSRAAEPVSPHGAFPLQLTMVLIGVFATWTLVNAVWSAPRDGAIAALRRLGGHPTVDHLYAPVIVGASGHDAASARLVEIGLRRMTLLSRTPFAKGERLTISAEATDASPALHARVRACQGEEGWFEIRARMTPENRAEKATLTDWLDRLDPIS